MSALAPKDFGLEYSTTKFTETEDRLARLGFYIYVFTQLEEAVIWMQNIKIYGFHTEAWTAECEDEQILRPAVPPRILFGSTNTFETVSQYDSNGQLLPRFTKMFRRVKLGEFVTC